MRKKLKGLLKKDQTQSRIHMEHVAPCENLEPFVEHFWFLQWSDGDLYHQKNLPHPNGHLVVDPQAKSGWFNVNPGVFEYKIKEAGMVLGVKFKSAAIASFYKANASFDLYSDAPLPVGWKALEDMLINKGHKAVITELSNLLIEMEPCWTDEQYECFTMVEMIKADQDLLKVDQLAQEKGCSTRTIQLLFKRWLGVSPKWVIERFRIFEAIDGLDCSADITDLAHRLGYFDSAHFNRAFKKMVGQAPSAYLKS